MHKFEFYGTWDECEKFWNDNNLNDKDMIIKSKKQMEKEKEEYNKFIKEKYKEYDKKNKYEENEKKNKYEENDKNNKKYDKNNKKYNKNIIIQL
jgi:hypothetical protein